MATPTIPKTPTKPKWILKLIIAVAVVIALIGLRGGCTKNRIVRGEWNLWWEAVSLKEGRDATNYRAFSGEVKKAEKDKIIIILDGNKGAMEGSSIDGSLYAGTWNDPIKGKNGEWRIRFVTPRLAIGWIFSQDNTRAIVLQKR